MSKNEDNTFESSEDKTFKLKAGIFLASVTGMAALVGFSTTLAAAKKKDPNFFDKGVSGAVGLYESGSSLAVRALGWGTLYAVAGCSFIFWGIWKLSGANDFIEFRNKMGQILPKIPKNDPPQSRTEFKNLTDLLTYLSSDEMSGKPKK